MLMAMLIILGSYGAAYAAQAVSDPDTGIVVSGEFGSCELVVEQMSATDDDYRAISSLSMGTQLRFACRLSLKRDGAAYESEGPYTVTYPMGEELEGTEVSVISRNGNKILKQTAVVENGTASVTVDQLRPMAVAVLQGETTISKEAKGVFLWICVGLLLLGMFGISGYLTWRRRHHGK